MESLPHISFKDFPAICRACFNKENLQNLNELNITDIFKQITDIEIRVSDELPNNICYKCIIKIEDVSSFITIAKRNDAYLRKILTEHKSNGPLENSYDSDIPGIEQSSEESEDEFDTKVDPPEYDIPIKEEKSLICESENETIKKTKSVRHSTQAQPSHCEVCSEEFKTKRSLLEHQKQSPSCRIRKFKCDNCEKSFFTKFKLDVHMRIHTKESPYECKICFKRFRHAPNLKRHEDIVHKGLRPFKCETCGKEFSRLIDKNDHVHIHTGKKPYICKYCGKTFRTYSDHFAHIYLHKISKGEIAHINLKTKMPESSDRLNIECTICNRSFSCERTVYKHFHNKISHANQDSIAIKKSLERQFLCTTCGKAFSTKFQLKTHSLIHSGEKPHVCQYCNKQFRHVSSYRNHLFIHTGEKPHQCKVCLRGFVQLDHLKTHMQTHTGERPHKCTYCGKTFAQKSNMVVHVRIHTGETPYHCSICNKGFYDSSSMKKHERGHEIENCNKKVKS